MIRKMEGAARRQLGVLLEAGSLGAWGDGALLDRFVAGGDATAEAAFALLVERHGPMVLRVCHTALGDEHDAHDAFQAVFLVLARRARSVRVSDTVGPWLYGVAWRVAARVRAAEAKRRRHEQQAAELAPRWVEPPLPQDDSGAALHEEIRRLPSGFREAVILCDLEGLTTDQAAERLGAPVGTVRSRLHRGRDRLRSRLLQRGLAPAAVGAVMAAGPASGAAIPAALVESAVAVALGWCRTGVVPGPLAWLVYGGRLALGVKTVAAGLAVGFVAVAGGLAARDRGGPPAGNGAVPAGAPAAVPRVAAPSKPPAPVPVKPDHERLQGTWSVVKATINGREIGGQNILGAAMTFADEFVEFGPFGSPPVKNRYRFQVDDQSTPRALHVERDGAKRRWWLYELQGDTLRTAAWLSLNNTRRPTSFDEAARDDSVLVLELVRGPRAATVASGDPAAARADGDLGRLQGTWTVLGREENGEDLPDGPPATVRIAGNTIVAPEPPDSAADLRIESFSIVPGTDPPAIVVTTADKERKSRTVSGIYRLYGAVLLLCLDVGGKGRPTEFDTHPGSGHRLIVLRRKKPSPVERTTPAPLPGAPNASAP